MGVFPAHVCECEEDVPKIKLLLAMGMHWIMRGWRPKTRILETMHFPEKHNTTNICDSLLNARTNFFACSKSGESKISQSEEAMSSDKLAYLATKPFLDTPMLMSECGSDVLVGAEKDNLLDCHRCAYPCLSIAVQAVIQNPIAEKFCTSCIHRV